MLTREQIEAIRAAMVAPIIWAIIVLLLLAALIPLGKKCKDKLRSMAAACREGGLKKFCQYLFIGWGISVAMHVSAVKPNDPSSHPAPQRAPIHRVVEEGLPEEESDAEPQPLPPLRITGVERTDEAVSGTLAWDGTNDIQGATTIDVFVAHPALTNEFCWVKSIEVAGPVSNCAWAVCTNELGVDEMPVALFVKMTERNSSSSTMADKDGDLLPDVYELRHGSNPYVPDFDQVSKTSLGPSVTQRSLQSALSASAPYDIISLPENGTRIESGVSMPPHPVMIVGPTNGYARIETLASPYAFVLKHGQCSHMLFQNLYINMLPDDDLQVGFWCGSDLPIGIENGSLGASGTFRNVYVRALGSGYGMGWLFRKWNETPVEIDHCVVNAAGSRSFKGVSLINAPEMVIRNCTFLNFPKENGRDYGAAIQEEVIGDAVNDCRLSVEKSVFDNSFTNAYAIARLGTRSTVTFTDVLAPAELSGVHAPDVVGNLIVASNCVAWSGHAVAGSPASEQGFGALAAIGDGATSDMDGDGLSDFDEVYVYGTNPLDPDSDGDGIGDYAEIVTSHTDPTDPLSHLVEIRLSVTNIVPSVVRPIYYGLSRTDSGWDVVDALLYSETSATNVILQVADGWYVKAFTDVDGNGVFDADSDVLLVKALSGGNSIVSVELRMGDLDGDLVADVQERSDGTDPYSADSLKIRRSVKVSHCDFSAAMHDYYQFSATTNWNPDCWIRVDSFPVTLTSDVFVDDGHCYLTMYRDFNGNGVYDPASDGFKRLELAQGALIEVTMGDSDGDGVRDRIELDEGTSPIDAKNFKVIADVYFECTDSAHWLTNYVQTVVDSPLPNPLMWQQFTNAVSPNVHIEEVVTNGVFYGLCFRDVNCNGIYDEGVDIFSASAFRGSKSHDMCACLIGDADGDGVPDSDEIEVGTDPRDWESYAFELDLTLSGLFPQIGLLKYAVLSGDSVVVGPSSVTQNVLTVRSSEIRTSIGAKTKVLLWQDLNSNGRSDDAERKSEMLLAPRGYHTVSFAWTTLGEFDADADGMLDDWECSHDLDPNNKSDAEIDSNENGIINLHEYYASIGWDCALEETALYSFCRSIDDRVCISPRKSVAKHIGSGLGLRRNPNCWEFGINTSCASPWNSTGSGTRAGTAISKRHIIFADHYRIGVGATVRFVGMDDVVYERTLLAEKYLAGTDIMIGLLSEDLPDVVLPAVILPRDFCLHLGDAKRLPMLMYDYSEHSIVTDSSSLFVTSRSADGMRPRDPSRDHYFEEVVSGDSGDPKFFVSGDTAILVCCLLSYGNGNSGIGPFVTYYKDRIQAIMDSLCPGYQLREFDFSAFRSLDEIE